jgi:hypothetical protein
MEQRWITSVTIGNGAIRVYVQYTTTKVVLIDIEWIDAQNGVCRRLFPDPGVEFLDEQGGDCHRQALTVAAYLATQFWE